MPFLANMALGAALVITLQRTVLKRAPEYKEKMKETAQEIRHKVVSSHARAAIPCTMRIQCSESAIRTCCLDEVCGGTYALHDVGTHHSQKFFVMQAAKAEELQLLNAERMLLAIESIDQVSQCCRLEQGSCQHLQRRAGTSSTWATRDKHGLRP